MGGSEVMKMKKQKIRYQPAKPTCGEFGRRLPMITLGNGKTYFIDERLKQLRNIKNPHDYIDF